MKIKCFYKYTHKYNLSTYKSISKYCWRHSIITFRKSNTYTELEIK